MEKYKKSAYIGINIVIYLALSYVLLRYALSIILPFAISFLIVSISRPLVNKISKHTRVPKGVISLFVIGIILVALIYLMILASSALLDQIGSIISKIAEHLGQENNYINSTLSALEELMSKFPFLKGSIEQNSSIYSIALEMATNAITALSSRITLALGKIIASMPEMVVTVVVILLSLFYFSKDYKKITSALISKLPTPVKEKLPRIKKDILLVISSFVRSYIIIFFITFAQVFCGLLILKVENAFAISIIVALVDILPVLGVGIVLVPWSLVALAMQNTTLGIGLLVLFSVVYVVRQIIEPRIVSSQMNVHPLIAIFAMYAGLKIAGIGGMIIAPFFAFSAKTIYDGLKNESEKQKEVEK